MIINNIYDLGKVDFSIMSVTSKGDTWEDKSSCNYLETGRIYNLVHIVTAGRRGYEYNNTVFMVGDGTVLLIPHGTHYKTWAEGKCSGIGVCFEFTDSELEIACGVYHDWGDEQGDYRRLFERLFESYTSDPRAILHHKSLMLRILDHMTTEYSAESQYGKILAPAVQFIHEHYCEKLPVSEYAAVCNLSESYFRRIFTKYIGMTPVEYRDRLRLDEAKRLRVLRMSMSEIAERVGFCDAAYLRKLFHKRTGQSINSYVGVEIV